MSTASASPLPADAWRPLAMLAGQREANVKAIATRDSALAGRLAALKPQAELFLAIDGPRVLLAAKLSNGSFKQLSNPVDAAGAQRIAAQLFPTGKCTEPVLVAGLDQGWLWRALYDLEISTPVAPGHRPPIYLLARELERLWIVLHLHDWTTMLADGRVRLFAGDDCVEQLRASMLGNVSAPWARLCVTVDPAIWPSGQTNDSLFRAVHASIGGELHKARRQLDVIYGSFDVDDLATRLIESAAGRQLDRPLRVLGITSRFTTFLKHSMNDWLAAFDAMGHDTHLVIEQADHDLMNSMVLASACESFRPDLVLLIDHYRGEFQGLPPGVPCVMWVQDQLPNIFSARGGAAQKERDYCLGFGRLALADKFGYPPDRYLPATVSVNEHRFEARESSEPEIAEFGCDVSYVSHASVLPEQIVADEVAKQQSPDVKRWLGDIFDRLRGEYETHGLVRHGLIISRLVAESAASLRMNLDHKDVDVLTDFFSHRVNNAMFRHQALRWLIDADVDLRIYGRGWERVAAFAKYARGIADNQTQLAGIYRASKINLQMTPHGAVHQRMLDGLAAGGFFLVRYTPGDAVETHYQTLWKWAMANDCNATAALRASGDPIVHRELAAIEQLLGVSPFELSADLIDVLRLSADGDFTRSAASVWPDYSQVCFDSEADLNEKVARYLGNESLRRDVAIRMRQPVIDRFTYAATNRRLMSMIADDLRRQSNAVAPLAA